MGVRINGVNNILAVRRKVRIPVIGIEKLCDAGSPVYITPTFASLRRVYRAGADIIALDCTQRNRPRDESLEEIIRKAKGDLRAVIMADVATVGDGLRAAELGADLVATTLHGYTQGTGHCEGPAFKVLCELVGKLQVPVILEGRLRVPGDVRRALDLGAYAAVVGTAITGIERLVREFVAATPRGRTGKRRLDID